MTLHNLSRDRQQPAKAMALEERDAVDTKEDIY